jgi:hypothetical protein
MNMTCITLGEPEMHMNVARKRGKRFLRDRLIWKHGTDVSKIHSTNILPMKIRNEIYENQNLIEKWIVRM